MPRYDAPVAVPCSEDEAVEAFGDGEGVAVLAGGTILMPELTYGRARPERVVLLLRAGLDRISRAGGTVTIGATVPIAALESGDEPLAEAARYVGDPEIRAQATVGGNLCADPGETPRGDLQAPLIALGAHVRAVGAAGERTEPLESADLRRRLLLEISYDDVERQTAYAAFWRPHTHHYTILAVAGVKQSGELRLAATGAAPSAVRLRSVEASGNPADAVKDADLRDDPLASAWYRRRVLPVLVDRVLKDLER